MKPGHVPVFLFAISVFIVNSVSDKSLFGDDEWYFFTPRDRKYPNGVRPNRTAASGFWKATGIDKPILSASGSRRIGVKKALVFYTGRHPKGVKTDWIMTEYKLPDTTTRPSRSKGSMRVSRLNPEKSIPSAVLKGAKGLLILTVAKVGALLTYKLGTGLVIDRRVDGS